jgi:cytidine deaminase
METINEGRPLDALDSESKYLIHKAKEAAIHAYAPYSKFCVGAAVILDDGTVVTGSNQENASSLHPGKKILKMAVVAHKKNHKELVAATSCGACRQVMVEYEERQKHPMKVVMLGPGEKWVECSSAKVLLPMGFDKGSLS